MVATRDLARLYNVETKVLNQAVKRNIERFPSDFMFRLDKEEFDDLRVRSQIVTSPKGGGRQYCPFAFTEQGAVMLSTILKSSIAIEMSIKIVNAFVKMRKYLSKNLLEQKYYSDMLIRHDGEIKLIQETLDKFEEKDKVNQIYFEGEIYDAYSKLKDIMFEAKQELIIIDSYADKTLLDMIKNINSKVVLITSKKSRLTKLDISKYGKQYHNLKVIYDNSYHDRYFIIDRKKIYHSGTSINYAGSKTFSINILEDNIVKDALLLKIDKYINEE